MSGRFGPFGESRDASHQNTRIVQENHDLRQELDEAEAALAELKKAGDS